MECNSNDKINIIVNDLIVLLKNNDEPHWAQVLSNILQDYKTSNAEKETAALFLKIMQGGMGSFLDLVLHKNAKPLIAENNRLDELRHKLYEECKRLQ